MVGKSRLLRQRRTLFGVSLAFALGCVPSAQAEVVSAATNGFEVRETVQIAASVDVGRLKKLIETGSPQAS